MNSDKAKKGYLRSPHRSLLKAAGYTDWEIDRPWIGVANAYNAIIPGHVHLRTITEAVKAGIYARRRSMPTPFSSWVCSS